MIENSFINIIGVAKWFVKVAFFSYPYFGKNVGGVDQANVSDVGEGWCWV